MQKALEVACRCSYLEKFLEGGVFFSLRPHQIMEVKPFIDQIKDDKEKVQMWLTLSEHFIKNYPKEAKLFLHELIRIVENCPDEKELDYEPGMGRKRDARIGYVKDKINFMRIVIEMHLVVGALEEAKKLKHHPLIKKGGVKSRLEYQLMLANYYKTNQEPVLADECYTKAIMMMPKVNAYDWDPDVIREIIARGLISVNHQKAFDLALGMREEYHRSRLLLKLVQATVKDDPKFAEKSLEQMIEDKFEAEKKAEAYLEFVRGYLNPSKVLYEK